MQDQALLESVRDMAVLVGECINAVTADLTVDTQKNQIQESLVSCQGCIEMLAMAATGISGVLITCKLLQENLEELSNSDLANWCQDSNQIITLLTAWPVLIQSYVIEPSNSKLHAELLTLFTHSCWPRPITEQQREDFLAVIQPDADIDTKSGQSSPVEIEDLSLTLDPELNPKLIAAFFQEAPLNVADFTAALSSIFKGENLHHNLALAQRLAHNLKGSANILGIKGLANLTHHIEDILEYLTAQQQMPPPELGQTLQEAADCLEDMMDAVRGTAVAPTATARIINDLQQQSLKISTRQFSSPTISIAEEKVAHETTNETITSKVLRLPTATIDAVFKMVSELSMTMDQIRERIQLLRHRSNELQAQNDLIQQHRFKLENFIDIKTINHAIKTSSVKSIKNTKLLSVTTEYVEDNETTLFDSLELGKYDGLYGIASSFIESVIDSRHIGQSLRHDLNKLEYLMPHMRRMQKELQTAVMQMRMEPVGNISARLHRSIRHACQLTGKEAELHIEGETTLIDSEMLAKLADPLMHILRNAIDHGIETTEERLAKGKTSAGQIKLRFFQEGQHVVAECTDDGSGLDYTSIRNTAINRGYDLSTATNQKLARLILEPGFSTRTDVTQLSGRGVGLDVVNSIVRGLRGTVHISDATTGGCQITLRLPLTLMTLHSLIIEVKEQLFAIPLSSIIRAISPGDGNFNIVDATINYTIGSDTYPATALAVRLGLATQEMEELRSNSAVLLINADTGIIAVAIDRLINIHNLVLKGLGKYIPSLRGITGLATLADGSLLPILNLSELLNWLIPNSVSINTNKITSAISSVKHTKLIMIVDDSLTVRQALITVIEDAGYQYIVARDGVDAVESLRQNKPDVMLCDIEMPRMNGFEVINHVRTKYGYELPIIMLTSRNSPKHKQQAMQLGANAYMTKPFNKDELLETMLPFLKI